jgi:phosphoribosylanthranilate isomerase
VPTPKVKICGITRLDDALAAVRLGADALGFNFWPRSKRYLPPGEARAIVRRLPSFVTAVGVFVDPTREEVLRAADQSGIAVAQLHGDEPPELCASLPLPVLKAIRVAGAHALSALASYEVQGFLLDTPTVGYGGSGQTFDWELAAEVARELPIVLAGGLGPENVAEAVRIVHPWAVDVASGVERAPGVKDPERMRLFIDRAKEAR